MTGQPSAFVLAVLAQEKLPEAIALLELHVEMCPRSANVYDSLGEAHAG